MDEQTSAASDAPETMLEKEHDSTLAVDQPESPDPPASTTTKERSEDPLRVLVTILTVRVLNKCHAFQDRNQKDCVAHTKHLVHQTMEGLAITKSFCPDMKSTEKMCKSVMKDLQKEFCSKRSLEGLIILQDPVVDKVLVQSLQDHIRESSARLVRKKKKKKAASPVTWKDVAKLLVIATVTLTLIFLTLLIL